MIGGETSASAVTLIGTGKAAATPTGSVSATSVAGAAPAGEATAGAGAAAGAGVAVVERAGIGSTEEAEVRKSPPPTTNNNNSTGEQRLRSEEAPESLVSTAKRCISDGDLLLETCWCEVL